MFQKFKKSLVRIHIDILYLTFTLITYNQLKELQLP